MRILIPTKAENTFAIWDDETESLTGKINYTELKQELEFVNRDIERTDILGDEKRLLEWAQRFYPMSGEGQMLARAMNRRKEIEATLASVDEATMIMKPIESKPGDLKPIDTKPIEVKR